MRTAVLRSLAALVLLLIANAQASAHPHMFFKSTAQFLFDEQGRLSKIRAVFLVDELNTLYTFAELGVNQDGDASLSDEEVNKIARNVVEGFGHYDFFTYLKDQGRPVALEKPSNVTVQLHQKRLGLVFLIPLETPIPLKGKTLTLQLYDPTYFTEISIDLPPMIVGQAEGCSVSVTKPASTEQSRQSQTLLSRLSREEKPDIENVGALFAETTRLTCPQ